MSELDSTEDPAQVVKIIQQAITGDSDFKILPARQWTENFLYYGGMRDIATRFATGTVAGNSLSGNIPVGLQSIRRRNTAKLFKAVQVQASNVTRQRPGVKVWPEDEDERAYKKAKLANMLLDYSWGEDFEEDMYYASILWCLLTPAVARKDYLTYEFNSSRTQQIVSKRMIPTAIVNQFGEQELSEKEEVVPALDDNGNPMFEQLPWHTSEIVPATRLIFNPTATWSNTIDFVGDVSVKRLGWIKQNYDIEAQGYTGDADKVLRGQWCYTPIMALEDALKNLAFGAGRQYRNFTYGAMPVKDGCVFAHFFIKPSPNYPHGREIAIANNVLLYDGESRSHRELPSMVWHPYSFMTYERHPARLWGSSYAEKLTELNRAYDQARVEFEQMRRTFAKAKLMLPIGCQVDRDIPTGYEETWRYNPYAADGGKPAYLNPPQPPTTVIEDIKLLQQEWVEISGVTEIMQGIRPQGVTTYRGLEVLREEASNSANNFIRMYENFIQRSQQNKLECIRKSLQQPDENLSKALRVFKRMNQYITDIDIKDFVGDDLSGYVKIEPYSTIGKSRLALQDKYMSLAQTGILGDVVNDPDLNSEFKRKVDVMGFDAPRNRQVEYARHENQMMQQAYKQNEIINPPVAPWHDHAIHIREIDNLLLDPTVVGDQEKGKVVESLIAHRQSHMQAQMEQMKMQMEQANAAAAAGMQGNIGQEKEKMNAASQPKQNEGMLFGNETGFVSNDAPQLA